MFLAASTSSALIANSHHNGDKTGEQRDVALRSARALSCPKILAFRPIVISAF